MITQRDTILQEVMSVFRRRPKVIKNVKIRNNRVIRKKKEGGRRIAIKTTVLITLQGSLISRLIFCLGE